MGLTREEVLHISLLARVGLSEDDVVKFQEQLSQILDHFQVLRQLDTEDVSPTSNITGLENVSRGDDVRESLPQDEVMANAPLAEDALFRVRAILE
ncbi:MAG: Asp-tRNA(Asn)/Glu-tRNA(Gln) amidotransferase subunit GatC [Dehalococcoidia bacterium]